MFRVFATFALACAASACCAPENAHADIVCTYEEDGESIVFAERRISCQDFVSTGYIQRDYLWRECESDGGDEVVRSCVCEEYPSLGCQECGRDD